MRQRDGPRWVVFEIQRARYAQDAGDVRRPASIGSETAGLSKALEFARVRLPLLARNKFAQDPVDVEAATAVDDVRRLGQSGVSAELS